MDCTCDPSFPISPPCTQRDHEVCFSYRILWLFIFTILWGVVTYEIYSQICKQYSRYLNLKLGCYLCVWISCLDSVIRFGLLIGEAGPVDLLDVMVYISYMFTHTSFTLLIYIWASSYIVAHQKSNSWLWGIRIVVVCWNLVFWVAFYTDVFHAAGAHTGIIMIVMLGTGCVLFLVFARKLQMVAKKDEANLESVTGSVAQKMSFTTYRTCFVIFAIEIIFVLINIIDAPDFNTTYFVAVYSMYSLMEVSLVGAMVVILHRKIPQSTQSQQTQINEPVQV